MSHIVVVAIDREDIPGRAELGNIEPDLSALRQVGAVLRIDVLRGDRRDRCLARGLLSACLLVLAATGGKNNAPAMSGARKILRAFTFPPVKRSRASRAPLATIALYGAEHTWTWCRHYSCLTMTRATFRLRSGAPSWSDDRDLLL